MSDKIHYIKIILILISGKILRIKVNWIEHNKTLNSVTFYNDNKIVGWYEGELTYDIE